jgi:lysophospholipase L1-like esterase
MTSLITIPRIGLSRIGRNRLVTTSFDGALDNLFNATAEEISGFSGSSYAIKSSRENDPFGNPYPHGVLIPGCVGDVNYKIYATVKGKGSTSAWRAGPAFDTSDEWATIQGVYRILVDGDASGYHPGAMFYGSTVEETYYDLYLGRVAIEQITNSERAAYSDEVLGLFAVDVPALSGTVDTRMQYAPTALAKLRSGTGTIKIALVGDSLIADTSNGSIGELLERSYPGITVTVRCFALGSHGVSTPEGDGWVDHDKSSIYTFAPDLIYQGGISDSYDTAADWATLISDYRANIDGVEIIVGSPTRDASYLPTYDTTRIDFVSAVADANNVAFFDATKAYYTWIEAAGITEGNDTVLRDGLHTNYKGQEAISRCLAWFLGASSANNGS